MGRRFTPRYTRLYWTRYGSLKRAFVQAQARAAARRLVLQTSYDLTNIPF